MNCMRNIQIWPLREVSICIIISHSLSWISMINCWCSRGTCQELISQGLWNDWRNSQTDSYVCMANENRKVSFVWTIIVSSQLGICFCTYISGLGEWLKIKYMHLGICQEVYVLSMEPCIYSMDSLAVAVYQRDNGGNVNHGGDHIPWLA